MRINKIASSHKISLAFRASIKKEAEPSLPSLEVCSLISSASKIQRSSFTSLDKQNKKQPLVAKPDTSKKLAKEPLKLRTYSTNPDLKLSHNSPTKLQQSKWPHKESTVQCQMNQIVELLKKNYILTQNHANNYAIRKDNFLKLVRYFLIKDREGGDGTADFGYLDCHTEEICQLVAEKARKVGQRRLKVASRVTSFVFNFEKYHQEVERKITDIQKLQAKKQGLLGVINQFESLTPTLAKEYLKLQTEINQSFKVLETAKADHAYLHNQKQALTKQIEECKKELDSAKENSQKIANYINHQNNKLLLLASQEYKTIESDIYEYASYLQCNQLASSLTYEPLSITCLTNDLEDQLREVNRNLIQNDAMDAKEKGKAMRDFVLEWINRFKKKDQEQKEVIRFKTKCVLNFIEKMKKWLENWTLKQEYLVGLRDQFSINTEKIKKMIADLTACQSCKQCALRNQPLAKTISMLYEKIETNYKLGNSFY